MTTSPARRRVVTICLASMCTIATPLATTRAQDLAAGVGRVQQQVAAIAAAEDNAGRRDAIVTRLTTMGLAPRLVSFEGTSSMAHHRSGVNIVADIGGGTGEVILLTAHYDRVARGRGVIDNGGGVAAVLELAEAFRLEPLGGHTVRIALFDLEEEGLIGSKAMVADSLQSPLPAVVLNIDIFGSGDAFWVGVPPPDSAAPLAQAIARAGHRAGIDVIADTLYPPSDHLSFRPTRTEAYAVSLLDKDDIEGLLAGLRGAAPAGGPPRIIRIIHSDSDTLDKLDAAAVVRGAHALEQALRSFAAERTGSR